MVVPHWKPSSWPWLSLFWPALLGCYSPEIEQEFSALGAGGQLGTNVRSDTLPQAGPPPQPFTGGAGSPPAPGGGGNPGAAAPLPPLTATPVDLGCTPRLAGAQELPAACAGEPYFFGLQLECAGSAAAPARAVPSAVTWLPTALPQELTLTPEGELLGSAALGPGAHELRARALLANTELEVSAHLEVLERCFVFALAQAPASSGLAQAQVLAQRLDSARSLWLPETLAEGSTILSFARAANGRWLAAVSSSTEGESLLLFQVRGGAVAEVRLEHAGAHVAHAFSPNSERLAVVTELSSEPGAPPDRRLSLVELRGLEAQAPQLALAEEFVVPYQTGLGWADAATLQFIGASPQFPTFFTPHTLQVPEAGLAGAELTELLYPMDPADLIRWFRPLPAGFYVMTNALSYVNRSATVAAVHLSAQALSPTYQLSAHAAEGRLLLHAPDTSDDQPAAFSADGCQRLLAWSGDGQSLLCEQEGGLAQHQLSEGGLTVSHVDTSWSAAGTQRSLLSQHGQWSVVADGEHGLFLLARGQQPPAAPLLAPSPATPGWDFGITRDERHLWVQQGQRLMLATLGASEASPLTLLSEAMAAPPDCAASGLPLPGAWCGSSELPGQVRLRGEGRYLAFADAAGALTLVDLAAPTRRQEPAARVADTCTEECVQFQ